MMLLSQSSYHQFSLSSPLNWYHCQNQKYWFIQKLKEQLELTQTCRQSFRSYIRTSREAKASCISITCDDVHCQSLYWKKSNLPNSRWGAPSGVVWHQPILIAFVKNHDTRKSNDGCQCDVDVRYSWMKLRKVIMVDPAKVYTTPDRSIHSTTGRWLEKKLYAIPIWLDIINH